MFSNNVGISQWNGDNGDNLDETAKGHEGCIQLVFIEDTISISFIKVTVIFFTQFSACRLCLLYEYYLSSCFYVISLFSSELLHDNCNESKRPSLWLQRNCMQLLSCALVLFGGFGWYPHLDKVWLPVSVSKEKLLTELDILGSIMRLVGMSMAETVNQ